MGEGRTTQRVLVCMNTVICFWRPRFVRVSFACAVNVTVAVGARKQASGKYLDVYQHARERERERERERNAESDDDVLWKEGRKRRGPVSFSIDLLLIRMVRCG